jgi:hypothetical protein
MKKTMKKFLWVILIIILVLLATGTVEAKKNEYYAGDKNVSQIAQSIKVFDAQIVEYQTQMDNYKYEFWKLRKEFQNSTDKAFLDIAPIKMAECDSMVAVYRNKIHGTEEAKQAFLIKVASKEQLQEVSFKSSNPKRLASALYTYSKAYETMTYADAYARKISNTSSDADAMETTMKGVVVNRWYMDVDVVITGPGGFKRGFTLSRSGGKAIFNLPYPGFYTAIFSRGGEERPFGKEVTLNPNDYSVLDGNNYKFKAVLPSSNY